MHTLTPTSRTYYITQDSNGAVTGSGYVDPGQELLSGADRLTTYGSEEAMNTDLAALGSPADLTTIDPAASVEAQSLAMCAKVNALRAIKLAQPVTYMGHQFDSDHEAIMNVNGIVAAIGVGIPLPEGFTWRSADNADVPMSSAQLVGLAAAMLAYRSACYSKSWALKAAINATNAPLTVTITAGWPA